MASKSGTSSLSSEPSLLSSMSHSDCSWQVVLQCLTWDDGWCGEDVPDVTLNCYDNILLTYHLHPEGWHGVRAEFLTRLIADFCSSIKSTLMFRLCAFKVLKAIFEEHANIPVPYTILCVSPFLSTRTPTSLSSSNQYLYPVAAVFVDRFTHINSPRAVVLQFMNDLCAIPQRLYTLCRVFALGDFQESVGQAWDERVKAHLFDLARLDVWKSRAHYMAMEPRD